MHPRCHRRRTEPIDVALQGKKDNKKGKKGKRGDDSDEDDAPAPKPVPADDDEGHRVSKSQARFAATRSPCDMRGTVPRALSLRVLTAYLGPVVYRLLVAG